MSAMSLPSSPRFNQQYINNMKKYKIRMECSSFHDVVVEADSKEQALNEAYSKAQCPSNGFEFNEFLPVEEGDELT